MFTVCLINFAEYRYFGTLPEAKAFVERACFEATVWKDGVQKASFSPIAGWKWNAPLRFGRKN